MGFFVPEINENGDLNLSGRTDSSQRFDTKHRTTRDRSVCTDARDSIRVHMMQEVRCNKCERKLAESTATGTLSIKCPRCKNINLISLSAQSTNECQERLPKNGMVHGTTQIST